MSSGKILLSCRFRLPGYQQRMRTQDGPKIGPKGRRFDSCTSHSKLNIAIGKDTIWKKLKFPHHTLDTKVNWKNLRLCICNAWVRVWKGVISGPSRSACKTDQEVLWKSICKDKNDGTSWRWLPYFICRWIASGVRWWRGIWCWRSMRLLNGWLRINLILLSGYQQTFKLLINYQGLFKWK